MRSIFGQYFPAFGLNMEIYRVKKLSKENELQKLNQLCIINNLLQGLIQKKYERIGFLRSKKQMFGRHLNLNFWVLGSNNYYDNDNSMVKNGKRKYYKLATYFILDFSGLIHRLLVKFNTIESRISKSIVSVFSQLVLHGDDIHAILHLQYIILHLCKDTR